MAKTYGVNTVDGCQIASLRAAVDGTGVLSIQPYHTNRIIRLQCAALDVNGPK